MMDMKLRTMIKCHGYWMATSWGMVVIWWTSLMLDPEQSHGYVKGMIKFVKRLIKTNFTKI